MLVYFKPLKNSFYPLKAEKDFLKVSLDDKRKMISGLVWNLSMDNKKTEKSDEKSSIIKKNLNLLITKINEKR